MSKSRLLLIAGEAGSGKDTLAEMVSRDVSTVSVGTSDRLKWFARDLFEIDDSVLWGSTEVRNVPDLRFDKQEFLDRFRSNYYIHVDKWIYRLWDDHLINVASQYLDNWFSIVMRKAREGATITPRYLLQSLGTEAVEFDPAVWIRHIEKDVEIIREGDGTYDPRYGFSVCTSFSFAPKLVLITGGRFPWELNAVPAMGGKNVLINRPNNPNTNLVQGAGIKNHSSETYLSKMPSETWWRVVQNDQGLDKLEAEARQIKTHLGL